MASTATNDQDHSQHMSAFEALSSTLLQFLESQDSDEARSLCLEFAHLLLLAAINASRCSIVSLTTVKTLHSEDKSWPKLEAAPAPPRREEMGNVAIFKFGMDFVSHWEASSKFEEKKARLATLFVSTLQVNEVPLMEHEAIEFDTSPTHKDTGSRTALVNHIREMGVRDDAIVFWEHHFPNIFAMSPEINVAEPARLKVDASCEAKLVDGTDTNPSPSAAFQPSDGDSHLSDLVCRSTQTLSIHLDLGEGIGEYVVVPGSSEEGVLTG